MILHTNVTIMVSDLNMAIDFYVNKLGFTLQSRYGDHWADVQGPGISLGLHPSRKERVVSDNLQLGLRVPDLHAAIAEFSKKGISCTVKEDGNVTLAFFHDPDGNTLYLIAPWSG